MTEDLQRQLDSEGYLVLPSAISAPLLSSLNDRIDELFRLEGELAGAEFKQEPECHRLANLVNKGKVFQEVVAHNLVVPWVARVLGDDFKLSSLNVRSVDPGGGGRQPLHADMGALPDRDGPWVCNVVWMLQDVTPRNGALRVVPGTHLRGALPQQVLEDPTAKHEDEIQVTGKAGTLVIFNAHLWHGGTANESDAPRRVMHAFYCRRDKPQQQYQKRLLDLEVQDSLSPQMRGILALDDTENDRISSEVMTTSGFMK